MQIDLTKTNGSSPPANYPTETHNIRTTATVEAPRFQSIPTESPDLSKAAWPTQKAEELAAIHQAVLEPQVRATIEQAVRKTMSTRRGPTKKDDIQDAISETFVRLLEPVNAAKLLSQSRELSTDPATGRRASDFLTFVYTSATKAARKIKRRAVSRKEVRITCYEGEEVIAPWDDHTLPTARGSTGKDARRFRISPERSVEGKLITKIDLQKLFADEDAKVASEYIYNRYTKAHTSGERVAFHRVRTRLKRKFRESFLPPVTNHQAKGTFMVRRPVRDVQAPRA